MAPKRPRSRKRDQDALDEIRRVYARRQPRYIPPREVSSRRAVAD